MLLRFVAQSPTLLYLYNFFVQFYYCTIRLAAFWNKKAAAWVAGRRNLFAHLQKSISAGDRVIWIHCSSAGEFEQGKPVIEALKKKYPGKKILITFFSPSGYRVAKNYSFADIISYLPLDTRENAERFVQLTKPELAVFVKYEFWYHHLAIAAFHHIPVLLISAVFRKEQVFFRQYGGFFRQMLHLFRHVFVQDQDSLQLLQRAGILHGSVGGDTRFDRVATITENEREIPFIDDFVAGKKLMVAGSTWPDDEEVLMQYIKQNKALKLIIAPHEINSTHISSMQELFPHCLLYSELTNKTAEKKIINQADILIIDSVGLLSQLYRYATIAYIGGGYTRDGIHNILEAATWGKPVLFGPNYHKYREAREMIIKGGAFSFTKAEDLKRLADDLLHNESHLQQVSLNAKAYIRENTGATGKIMQVIQEKRLLTN